MCKLSRVATQYEPAGLDAVSSGTQVQTRNELQRDGVLVDRVESDFVSHQTVYNHLTNCLGAKLEAPRIPSLSSSATTPSLPATST